MARSSGAVVTGLTAAALAVVAFFAFQAAAAQDDDAGRGRPAASPTPSAADRAGTRSPAPAATALPPRSGEGRRVVYALKAQRVWLVGADGEVARSYPVKPSTVHPEPGTYTVTSKTPEITGSDGVPIEHVVIFTSVDGVVVGFSAAVDGSLADPDPSLRTGGIRQARADGAALWRFAEVGTQVVVVP